MSMCASSLMQQLRRLAVLSNLPTRPVLEKTAILGAVAGMGMAGAGLAGKAAIGTGKYVAGGQGVWGKVGRGTLLSQAADVPEGASGAKQRTKMLYRSFKTGVPAKVFRKPKAPAPVSRGFQQ